jgi:hypothetical protein
MCRFSHIYNVSVVLTFVCVISYIYNVPIFLLFMDSFCSSRWPSLSFFRSCPAPVFPIYDPPPRLFWPFLCRLCVRFLIYVMIVLFSVRSVLCPVYMYCVCIDIACPHFFVHVRLRSFGSMTPPCIFWPFLSCFTSSCVVSVRISVRLFCVPSTCIVSCIWLSFTLQSFFYLLSCPASVFLSWLCISSCLLLYKRHLFCWIGTKKQSSRHSVSTISSALFCSLSWHSFYSTYY